MRKQETASTFKVSIQLVWGFGSHQFKMPSFQTNNKKCITDSDAHQQNMAFVPDLMPQALTKLGEVCMMLITGQAL